MVQNRIFGLVIISILNQICENLDYGNLIATFSEVKV
jgi:hypothetical protein